jgi:hypothetical protein
MHACRDARLRVKTNGSMPVIYDLGKSLFDRVGNKKGRPNLNKVGRLE